jgi:hypothetical protein
VALHARPEGVFADDGVDSKWRAAQARFAARSSRGRLVVASASGHHPEEDDHALVVREIVSLVEYARR